jgi:hypothetical protein
MMLDLLTHGFYTVQAQQRVVADLSSKATALGNARRWEADALERAFRGAAGDGRENELEQQLAAIAPRVGEVGG